MIKALSQGFYFWPSVVIISLLVICEVKMNLTTLNLKIDPKRKEKLKAIARAEAMTMTEYLKRIIDAAPDPRNKGAA